MFNSEGLEEYRDSKFNVDQVLQNLQSKDQGWSEDKSPEVMSIAIVLYDKTTLVNFMSFLRIRVFL